MGELPQPEKPTTAMRVVLGTVVAAFASFTAVPVILVLAALFTLGLFCGAAVTLEHVGALDSPVLFRVAHWSAVLPLVIFFVAAYAHRLLKRDAKGKLAFVLRWPVLTACLALPFLTLLVLRLAWDTTLVSPLAGALVLADLYFFSVAALLGMLYVAVVAARAVYAWAAAGKYRAGLVTGVLIAVLALLLALGYRATPNTRDSHPTREAWAGRVAAAREPEGLETERQLLRLLDDALEPKQAPADLHAASAPTGTMAPLGTGPAPPPSPIGDDDAVNACLRELAGSQVLQVQRSVQNKFRLSDDDAHDIVYEALLNVCEAHATRKYDKPGAVLQTAAERRAIDWRRRRYQRCAMEGDLPRCTPWAGEFERAEQIDRILDAVRCDADPATQRVLDLHVREGKDFVTIDRELGLRPNEARWKWNNYTRKAAESLEKDCVK